MPDLALARARLTTQGIIARPFADPLAVVRHMGAMQAQDLPGVISSVVLRLPSGEVRDVIAAMDAGQIVRGYPMRGTVFLTPASELAWLTQLCAGPALRAAERRRGQLGLSAGHIDQAADIATSALWDEPRGLPRADLFAALQQGNQPTDAGRGYHILAYLIGAGLLCYGPWNGTEMNIVLTQRWLPAGNDLDSRFNGDRVAAVASFLRTYLTGHGPASLQDFAWWTKLPMREIKAAHALIADELEPVPGVSGSWQRPGLAGDVERDWSGSTAAAPLLLPGFDEFILGYQDRLFAMDEAAHLRLVPGNNGVFQKSVVLDGRVVALWKLRGRPGRRSIVLEEFETPLTPAQRDEVQRAFDDFPHANG